jgi:hypothetical protein
MRDVGDLSIEFEPVIYNYVDDFDFVKIGLHRCILL